jgi:hypothetical protein
MTNPLAILALHAADAYAKAASHALTQQPTTLVPKTLLYALGTTVLATVLYKSSTKPYTILHTLMMPFKYFFYKFQRKRQTITTPPPFEEKYVKEYDEWLNRQAPTLTLDEKERLENMYYSTVRETINDFYGDVIMCYDHATLSFAYYARTGNIPYKYLETISRKYMIETDAPREIHVDIREEVNKAKNRHNSKSATTTSTTASSASSQDPSQEDGNPFAKLKSYNTASNLNLHTTTNETKERTHKFASSTSIQDTSSSTASAYTAVIRENANRYSYRGKLSDFDEHHKTFLADRRKAAATATATPATSSSSYAEYKKQMLQRSAL